MITTLIIALLSFTFGFSTGYEKGKQSKDEDNTPSS